MPQTPQANTGSGDSSLSSRSIMSPNHEEHHQSLILRAWFLHHEICPDRDLNPGPSDWCTCVLTMRPTRRVIRQSQIRRLILCEMINDMHTHTATPAPHIHKQTHAHTYSQHTPTPPPSPSLYIHHCPHPPSPPSYPHPHPQPPRPPLHFFCSANFFCVRFFRYQLQQPGCRPLFSSDLPGCRRACRSRLLEWARIWCGSHRAAGCSVVRVPLSWLRHHRDIRPIVRCRTW